MSEAYPRDMIGYGRTPPFADWPGGARVALQFVINYEEGGENNILHGDAASEAFLSEIVGAAAVAGHAPHEHGVDLRIRLARRLLAAAPAVHRARRSGHRLRRRDGDGAQPASGRGDERSRAGRSPPTATSGSTIATRRARSRRKHIAEAIRIHTEVAGKRPLGFYQGRSSINTIPLGCEEGGFLYCADAYADDLPYWIDGPKGPQLIVPYTLDSNDMRFAAPQGFNSGDQFYTYLKDAFDVLYAEGATAPKMLSIGLHCRLVGRPARAASLARFVDYALGHDKVWFATRLDIARHWIAKHPPPGGWKPSKLTRTLFVERFGGVYEHSPWIAEAAYDAGLERGGRQRRRARRGDGARRRQGQRGAEAGADRRASRPRRQAGARQRADRRIRRASRRAPASTG